MVIEVEINEDWRQALYQRKAPGLILYGRALGLSHSEAEDVLQETFVALLRLDRPPDEPVHYCLRAYRNRALNYRRTMWRRLAREWESLRWFETRHPQDEAEAAAMRCLRELPREQREVIVLKIWNQLTFDAIARLLEVSPNTVAGRYRYGINKLRIALKGTHYGHDELGGAVALLKTPSPLA